MQHRRFIIFLSLVCAGWASFSLGVAHAAILRVSSRTISIDTQGQSINAIEIHLAFDPQKISVQDLSDGGSIVSFWVRSPEVSNQSGTLDLLGIAPGGVITANGTIVSFRAVSADPENDAQLRVVSARVLLNDGKGTPAALSIVDVPFLPGGIAASSMAIAVSPPDPFVPRIGRDPSIFGGDYFVAFSTTDPRSGIDHYEILEGADTVWHNATSPYRLEDQGLSSNIYIRAVNKAGSFRVVELPATHPKRALSGSVMKALSALIIGCIILFICGSLLFLWRKKRR